ncbi:GDSL esterase/lipase CPRD49 [Capsicum chinense]|nr:GDSL esterase/lipase CPRD49 [Capsicum chinense]
MSGRKILTRDDFTVLTQRPIPFPKQQKVNLSPGYRASKGDQADILLRGYAGWNSRCGLQVLDEVFPKDATVQPSLVIIYFGGNDSLEPHPSGLGAHVPLPEYVENMRKIAIHLKSLSEKTRIIFLTAPAISEAQITEVFGNCLGRSNESCRKYSEACVQLCQELGVKVIDLWKAIQQRDDWSTACFTDGIHLSSEGSNIVVKEILEVLKETDWEPNLHWRSLPTEFPEISPYIFVGPKGETAVKVSQLDLEWQTQWH